MEWLASLRGNQIAKENSVREAPSHSRECDGSNLVVSNPDGIAIIVTSSLPDP